MKKLEVVLSVLLIGLMIGCYDSGGTKHVILFIGDGMHLEQEIAASRCLTGWDNGLVFHRFPCRGVLHDLGRVAV
ncbi:MAG TPA: hypothetical protein PLM53_03280 [Spirochaetota bacterium]|nr:hypothetical protein [Spirochaetota bacterium]